MEGGEAIVVAIRLQAQDVNDGGDDGSGHLESWVLYVVRQLS